MNLAMKPRQDGLEGPFGPIKIHWIIPLIEIDPHTSVNSLTITFYWTQHYRTTVLSTLKINPQHFHFISAPAAPLRGQAQHTARIDKFYRQIFNEYNINGTAAKINAACYKSNYT